MRKNGGYLRADVKRSLVSMKLITAILLTVAVLLLATLEGIALNTDVYYIFSLVMYGMPAMIVLICAAIPYADSFCEDIEKRYIYQQAIRGDIKMYVSARVLSIFLSAVITVSLGLLIYVILLSTGLEWIDKEELQTNLTEKNNALGFLLRQGWYILYYFCYGIWYGILGGILALWASYLSLHISNRMLTLAAPMIIYYFTDFLLVKLFQGRIDLSVIFSPANSLFSNAFLSILTAAGIAIVNLLFLRWILFRKLRRKINE